MTEEELIIEAKQLSRWQQHKFMVLVGVTIIISLVLVMISLRLYRTSGAAQLDLSRPGYQSIRKQVSEASEASEFTAFPATGPLDKEAIDTFRTLYDKQLAEAAALGAFGGDVMSDVSLGLDAPAEQ